MKCAARRRRVNQFGALLVLLGLLPVSAAGGGQERAKREFHKTLTLEANQTVSVEHKFGNVEIHGGTGREVQINAKIHAQAATQQEADSFAEKVQIDVTQGPDGIRIHTIYPDERAWSLRIGRKPSYSVEYDIVVPGDGQIWVKNAFGNVSLQGVHGWTDVANSNGQISDQDGGAAKLVNSFGQVEASGMEGNLTIVNSNGSVMVSRVKGNVDIKDRFAEISVSNVQGTATISGGNGSVELTDVGASTINSSFGEVRARNIHGALVVNNHNGGIEANVVSGSAELNGSFAGITFANISGKVRCTNGNGAVKGIQVSDDVYVKSTFGEVKLEQIGGSVQVEDSNGNVILRGIKGYAQMSTSFGSIEGNELFKGARVSAGNGRVSLADVNGETFVKTSFGGVEIQRANGNVTVENTNGAVTENSVQGDAITKTSFGGVSMSDVAGAITVDNQNGAVMVSASRSSSPCRTITVKTSSAPIQVRLPETVGFNLSAKTSFGRISSELPVSSTGLVSGDSLNGKIGIGGCALSLTNTNSNIEILKLNR